MTDTDPPLVGETTIRSGGVALTVAYDVRGFIGAITEADDATVAAVPWLAGARAFRRELEAAGHLGADEIDAAVRAYAEDLYRVTVDPALGALFAAATRAVSDHLIAAMPASMEAISDALYAYAQARIGGDPYRADILAAFTDATAGLDGLSDRMRDAIIGWLRAMYRERPATEVAS